MSPHVDSGTLIGLQATALMRARAKEAPGLRRSIGIASVNDQEIICEVSTYNRGAGIWPYRTRWLYDGFYISRAALTAALEVKNG